MEQVDFDIAVRHYEKYDPLLYDLLSRVFVNLPPKKQQNSYFQELCESIVSQQLSVKAARSIWLRFMELVTDVSPQSILFQAEENLRLVGLSRQKISYLQALSEAVDSKSLRFTDFHKLGDEEVVEQLCQVKGIGRWTAEMFLLFTLGRKDVFSLGDLGLRNATNRLYDQTMTKEDLVRVSSAWSPHRSVASLILWSSLDNQPKS